MPISVFYKDEFHGKYFLAHEELPKAADQYNRLLMRKATKDVDHPAAKWRLDVQQSDLSFCRIVHLVFKICNFLKTLN